MFSLQQRIEHDLITAMKAGDILTRDTLRMLKTALKNKEIEQGKLLSDDEVVTVLRKEAKSRQEAVDQYQQAGREEQAEKEKNEKKIIEGYLPTGLSEEELVQIVTATIQEVGATSQADIGKVMGVAMSKVQGRADGGTVAILVRQHLKQSNHE